METRVISVRIPRVAVTALEQSAARANVSVARAVDWLARNSFDNSELLRELGDCPEPCNVKVDARISVATIESLRGAAVRLGISMSVYIRQLVYHFYITKKVWYVESDGRYTLAFRHD
jgi:hypothetical protein